jgi:hypothetical protein
MTALAPQSVRALIDDWLPGIIAGGLAWMAFIMLGETSIIRASGLALIIFGFAITLRRSGAMLAITGALALAFSPAFWSQTGGADDLDLPLTLIALAAAGGVALLLTLLSRTPYIGLAVGFGIFAGLFWWLIAEPGSLRLNTLATAGLLYLLVNALYITNPRPDDTHTASPLSLPHAFGMLVIFAVGVVNDPLFTLLVPALVLGLILCKTRLPWWYWGILTLFALIGVRGLVIEYVNTTWWVYSAQQAQEIGLRVPYVIADGWREASRWISLIQLVIGQFTIFGVLLGGIGLARLSRWYPPLGTVTMVAYATYALFGLVYFGRNADVLLLPLLMIQVFWMTYAVYTVAEWLKSAVSRVPARWLAPAAYALLPLLLLITLVRGG